MGDVRMIRQIQDAKEGQVVQMCDRSIGELSTRGEAIEGERSEVGEAAREVRNQIIVQYRCLA